MIIPSEPSQAIRTISIHKDYVKIHPLIVDATPIKYNSFLPDRTGNNSVNSTFMQQENLNETRNPTQQDIQNSSHFVKEQISETIATTTQQSYSSKSYSSKTEKPHETTDNIRIYGKTLRCSKIYANGLSSIYTNCETNAKKTS